MGERRVLRGPAGSIAIQTDGKCYLSSDHYEPMYSVGWSSGKDQARPANGDIESDWPVHVGHTYPQHYLLDSGWVDMVADPEHAVSSAVASAHLSGVELRDRFAAAYEKLDPHNDDNFYRQAGEAAFAVVAPVLAERDRKHAEAEWKLRETRRKWMAAAEERDELRAHGVARDIGEANTQLRELLGHIWLYVDWRYVTKQLTTEQKELWADAVDDFGDPDGDNRNKADRWWRDGQPDTEATEQPEPAWKIEVEIPARVVPTVDVDALFRAVGDAVHAWEPADRDGWDAFVSAGPANTQTTEHDPYVPIGPELAAKMLGATTEQAPREPHERITFVDHEDIIHVWDWNTSSWLIEDGPAVGTPDAETGTRP